MSECFPPVPLYIAAGIIVAMFTTVTSNIDASGELRKGDLGFAAFLLVLLAVPLGQLLLILLTATATGQCGGASLNSDGRWLLGFHCLTVFPLLLGAVHWFWTRSGTVGRRLRFQRPSRSAAG